MPPTTSFGNSLPVGTPAPDFDAGGGKRLSSFRGSPVVLLFHAEHWDPARREQVQLYNRLIANLPGAAGAKLVSVTGSRPWRDFTFDDDGSVAIPVLTDQSTNVAHAFGLDGQSAVFVIDVNGIIAWQHVGSSELRVYELGEALAAAATATTNMTRAGIWSRRDFVATALGVAFAITIVPALGRAEPMQTIEPSVNTLRAVGARDVTLNLNGRDVVLHLEPRVTLLDALRDYAQLTGTKKGCDHGQCGACTVHVDGRRELSCLTLAMMAEGRKVTTIEGLAATAGAPATGDALHPVQQAFITHDGFQCGYCTSGQIMSTAGVLHEPWGPGDDDVREAMSGNICRCGAYPGIVAAVQEARRSAGGQPR